MDFTHTNISSKKGTWNSAKWPLKRCLFQHPSHPASKASKASPQRKISQIHSGMREGKQGSISESLKRFLWFAFDSLCIYMYYYVLASAKCQNLIIWSTVLLSLCFQMSLAEKVSVFFFSVTKLSMVTRFHCPGRFLHRVFLTTFPTPKIKGSPGAHLDDLALECFGVFGRA